MANLQDPVSPLSHQPSQPSSTHVRRIPVIPPSNRKREKLENVIILEHRYYVCLLVFVYATLAIGSWSVLCLLSQRPLTTNHYGYDSDHNGWGYDLDTQNSIWIRNERWLQAALVMWSIVNLLTIPLTSTVCAWAAVRFTQFSSAGTNLTLRQTLLLADRGWINIPFLTKLIINHKAQGRNAASRFVFIALVLHLLGIIISPLQQILVTQETTKRPTMYYTAPPQTGMTDICEYWVDNGYEVAKLQTALQDASLSTVQHNLWASGHPCSISFRAMASRFPHGYPCTGDGTTFYSLSGYPILRDPFVAQLPSGSNTGLLRQHVPRINSSTSYLEIDKIPDECLNSDSFRASYSGPQERTPFRAYWSISICLPAVKYPIQPIKDRQDFQEDLYFTIETNPNDRIEDYSEGSPGLNATTFQISMKTTMGFFELPNYYNGGKPGPLLDKGPNLMCADGPCVGQSSGYDECDKMTQGDMEHSWHILPDPWEKLMSTRNRGPLTTIALALFGKNSFLARAHSTPLSPRQEMDLCSDIAPLGNLMEKDNDDLGADITSYECFTDRMNANIDKPIAIWLTRFANMNTTQTVWDQAAFLTNLLWLTPRDPLQAGLAVNFDPGKDTQKPAMSSSSMIIISVLLGLDLLALAVLAIVASRSVLWTQTLDALALVRLGVSLGKEGDELLHLGKEDSILDQLPGYIGDNSASNRVGTMSLGSKAPLRSQRSYSKRLGYTWEDDRSTSFL